MIATIREYIQYMATSTRPACPATTIDESQELYYPAIMRAISQFARLRDPRIHPKNNPSNRSARPWRFATCEDDGDDHRRRIPGFQGDGHEHFHFTTFLLQHVRARIAGPGRGRRRRSALARPKSPTPRSWGRGREDAGARPKVLEAGLRPEDSRGHRRIRRVPVRRGVRLPGPSEREVVAVSDLFPDRCAAVSAKCRCAKTYPSLEELVKDDSIEAVFVATDAPQPRPALHRSAQARQARGRAVPAVFGSLEDADKLFETVKATG